MRWFVMHEGKTEGPVEGEEVFRMGKVGRLFPTTHVRDEAGAWMPITQSPFASAVSMPEENRLKDWAGGDPGAQRDQLKLIYDYVKFHIQLYVATPAVLVLVADGFGVKGEPIFFAFLVAALTCFLCAGISAGRFMGTHVNSRWTVKYLESFSDVAFLMRRRHMHHSTYWAGLFLGALGIMLSVGCKHPVAWG